MTRLTGKITGMSVEKRLELLEKSSNNLFQYMISQTAINIAILRTFEEAGMILSDELEETMRRSEELIKELQKRS